MNMNKALQNLYKAVSGEDTTKVNISKLLVDIHYAATGVECAVKNNWARIIDSLATNWTGGGGGGSSDFSTCTVTVTTTVDESRILVSHIEEAHPPFVPNAQSRPYNYVYSDEPTTLTVVLYKGHATGFLDAGATATVTGGITSYGTTLEITGDGTIAIS